jgi:hypothetical protein
VIDWTKPVEFLSGTPVRVERVLEDGDAILSWIVGYDHTVVQVGSPHAQSLRNVAPRPREWWIEVSPGVVHAMVEHEVTTSTPGRSIIHVREVLEET